VSYSKLRGRIREKFGTQAAFAEAMGKSTTTVSAKLRGAVDWTRQEIEDACNLLDIPATEVGSYFFTF
jgi:hypothetical protein